MSNQTFFLSTDAQDSVQATLSLPNGVPFPEWYTFFMDYRTPTIIAALYATVVHFINSRLPPRQTAARQPSSRPFKAFVFAHNLALCIFSIIVCRGIKRGLQESWSHYEGRVHDWYCDTDKFLFERAYNSLGYWGYLFYLSKFYEIIDTVIILLKGRRSSTLQTYHHTGAILCMWAAMNYMAISVWGFVQINSFIHSVMYFYFALTSIGLYPPGKKYITTMQITQFLVGIGIALSSVLIPKCVTAPGSRFAVWLNIAYLIPLTYLFFDFAIRSYGRKAKRQ
ncbi:uncharacterized protein VTP21DRAFT_11666 [Calcarisporiella thermophila]|uniref:uncharacterized protein n=1 Tax=Calcarisporiella thermophila TaxID=911321 RepID=UPI0037421722